MQLKTVCTFQVKLNHHESDPLHAAMATPCKQGIWNREQKEKTVSSLSNTLNIERRVDQSKPEHMKGKPTHMSEQGMVNLIDTVDPV